MQKTFICLLCALFITAAHPSQSRLDSALQKLFSLPEAKELLSEIEQDGKVRFMMVQDHEAAQFGAFWDLDNRVIAVNPSFHQDEGSIIGSILFEMQNAKRSHDFHALFEQAQKGLIEKENYVRAVEYIEFQNSHAASKMADAGIRKGLFQPSAALGTYRDFDEHYYWQQYGGHSHQIGLMYERISPKSYSRNG